MCLQARALGRRRGTCTSWRAKFRVSGCNADESAGQGFGQAAEDAHELAGQLAARGFTAEALRAYEGARVGRMKRIAETELVTLFPP
jgi:2-polyprenyl-6-methoxyphenol hydroxylase-like FAD-dependent oxidoreductase